MGHPITMKQSKVYASFRVGGHAETEMGTIRRKESKR